MSTSTMVRKKHENEYDGDSSFTKSPGAGISKRTWSPGQAALFRRRKVEGESTVDDSFDSMNLSDLHNDADDEAEDYLQKSLDSIAKSDNKRQTSTRVRRNPRKSVSSCTSRSGIMSLNSGTPRKSYSNCSNRSANTAYSNSSDSIESRNKSTSPYRSMSKSPSRRRRNCRSNSPGKYERGKLRAKSIDGSKPLTNQKDLPIEIQQRLYRVTDPDISIKKKVELELEFMKGTPEERRAYLEFRNHFDRQEFFDAKAIEEQQKQDNIESNAREESIKEATFLKTVERKRQKERRMEEEAKERERKAIEEAQMHTLGTIANAMSEIKTAALEAATVSVARNQYEKKSYDEERRKLVENFRKNEGKKMTDVERALKEAVIEQEDPEEKRFGQRAYRPYTRNKY